MPKTNFEKNMGEYSGGAGNDYEFEHGSRDRNEHYPENTNRFSQKNMYEYDENELNELENRAIKKNSMNSPIFIDNSKDTLTINLPKKKTFRIVAAIGAGTLCFAFPPPVGPIMGILIFSATAAYLGKMALDHFGILDKLTGSNSRTRVENSSDREYRNTNDLDKKRGKDRGYDQDAEFERNNRRQDYSTPNRNQSLDSNTAETQLKVDVIVKTIKLLGLQNNIVKDIDKYNKMNGYSKDLEILIKDSHNIEFSFDKIKNQDKKQEAINFVGNIINSMIKDRPEFYRGKFDIARKYFVAGSWDEHDILKIRSKIKFEPNPIKAFDILSSDQRSIFLDYALNVKENKPDLFEPVSQKRGEYISHITNSIPEVEETLANSIKKLIKNDMTNGTPSEKALANQADASFNAHSGKRLADIWHSVMTSGNIVRDVKNYLSSKLDQAIMGLERFSKSDARYQEVQEKHENYKSLEKELSMINDKFFPNYRQFAKKAHAEAKNFEI